MPTQKQNQAVNALEATTNHRLRWYSVDYKKDATDPYAIQTHVNLDGDVIKVYPDGRVMKISAEAWDALATEVRWEDEE